MANENEETNTQEKDLNETDEANETMDASLFEEAEPEPTQRKLSVQDPDSAVESEVEQERPSTLKQKSEGDKSAEKRASAQHSPDPPPEPEKRDSKQQEEPKKRDSKQQEEPKKRDSRQQEEPKKRISKTQPTPSPERRSTATDEIILTQEDNDVLREQFDNYMRIAYAYMNTLKRPKDLETCSNLLRRVEKISRNPKYEVKRNNIRFLRYCLRVLKYTSENQPLEYYCKLFGGKDQAQNFNDKLTEQKIWMKNKKSFFATKTLRDGTSIFYIAVANDENTKWEDGGLETMQRALCDRH